MISLVQKIKNNYKSWKDFNNEKTSVTLSKSAAERIHALLKSQVAGLVAVPRP